MKRGTIILIILQFLMSYGIGQDHPSFGSPVKIPILLSGNFGEIRMDHFHSGIDIKTQGSTGHPIFSAEDGYISRIKVQANGYGRSLYITHPNGYTSVYGHLDSYREDIAAYVNNMQYQQQSQLVDLYLNRETFPVKRGDFIAYSGNSGSSSGPHLHFEIRITGNQNPTNVLLYPFEIKDLVPPRFLSLHIAPLDNTSQVNGRSEKFSIGVVKDNGVYTIPYGTRTEGSGTLGFSVEVFDYMNDSPNRCGIYSLEMFVGNELVYNHVMDEFSFSETKYVHARMDYEECIIAGIFAHRLYRLPNDRLRIYSSSVANKPLVVDEPGNYPIRIVASDVAGNSSVLEFTLKGAGKTNPEGDPKHDSGYIKTMKYNQANHFEEGPVKVDIPANALYQNMDFTFNSSPAENGSLTPFYHIAGKEVPVHSYYTLSVTNPVNDPRLRSKLLLITYNDEKKIVSAGGAFKNGAVVARLSNFGAFAVALDTIPPFINPSKNSMGPDLSRSKELRFTIMDDLSGIEKYEGYIDNHWALFEYDPKNDLLIYRFDENRIIRGTEHELELYVSDQKGNSSFFHTTFKW